MAAQGRMLMQAFAQVARTAAQAEASLIARRGFFGAAAKTNEAEAVKGLFDKWNAALATLDPKKVAACYAPDGVLLPTVSNKVRTSPTEIEDYFKAFLQLKPQGVIDQSNVRMLSDNSAIHSGVYTFTLKKPEGPVKVQARFSFLYKKVDGEWKIADHHSSAMPEVDPAKEIRSLFDKWNSALATLDPKKVTACYHPNGVLLPTVSNKVRTNPAEIEDYFKAFLQLKPQGVIDQSIVRYFSPDSAVDSGVYTFTLQKPEGPVKVQARYSFHYKKNGSEWKIIDHHSSAMPEPVA
jgi:uncharacterized protein (TIGR02246 family)